MKLEPDAKRRIAQKLRAMREERGLTQTDLGNILGRAYTTVASWESGKGQPDVDTLLRLMSIYQINDVVAEFGYASRKDSLTLSERRLIQMFRDMDEPAKELFSAMAVTLSGLHVEKKDAPQEQETLRAVARSKSSSSSAPNPDLAVIDALPDEGWTPKDK